MNENFVVKIKKIVLLSGIKLLANKKPGSSILIKAINRGIRNSIRSYEFTHGAKSEYMAKVQAQFLINFFKQVLKNIGKGYISKEYVQAFINNLVRSSCYREEIKVAIETYKNKYGVKPPKFVFVSPTQKCNLKCTDCYAASSPLTLTSLPYHIVERLIKEMHNICGSRLSVISGGEPFMWKDGRKDIISLAEEFTDMFFMVYTNGTLMSEENLKRLKQAANMTLVISVEGYEEQTDKRRGKGVYQKILKNIDRIKKYGIPFGVSVTVTKENIDILMQNDFYEYLFEELGATYMYTFHLMPIGRAKDAIELMLTPDQRLKFTLKWEELLFKKGYFVADFGLHFFNLNTTYLQFTLKWQDILFKKSHWGVDFLDAGPVDRGCIAYGRPGGYFYVDWNGNIMPCALVPFYKDNIYNLYKQDKTIADALMSDLFVRGRKWQSDFVKDPSGNFFTPCAIMDHYRDFREKILTPDTKPEDEYAKLTLEDQEYFKKMDEFDSALQQKMAPLWKKRMKTE